MKKLMDLKTHLTEDRSIIEAKLAEPERQKLRPFLDAAAVFTDFHLKINDLLAYITSVTDKNVLEKDALALYKEFMSLQSEYKPTMERFFQEYLNLSSFKLKYLR